MEPNVLFCFTSSKMMFSRPARHPLCVSLSYRDLMASHKELLGKSEALLSDNSQGKDGPVASPEASTSFNSEEVLYVGLMCKISPL